MRREVSFFEGLSVGSYYRTYAEIAVEIDFGIFQVPCHFPLGVFYIRLLQYAYTEIVLTGLCCIAQARIWCYLHVRSG